MKKVSQSHTNLQNASHLATSKHVHQPNYTQSMSVSVTATLRSYQIRYIK